MSGQGIAEFLDYWTREGARLARQGDYDWMAAQTPGVRVLEIGCGPGFSTEALLRRQMTVLSLDSLDECLMAAGSRCGDTARFVKGNVAAPDSALLETLAAFDPDTVVCWLMGAPGEVTGGGPTAAGQQAVGAYRESVHRRVAELAAALPGVRYLHWVDRTAIPWQAKDIGRDTLVAYHNGKTLLGLPFAGERGRALYRKIDNAADGTARLAHGAVPVLASLVAARKD